jgi:hypothetical protein
MALVLDGNGTMTVGNGDITGITRGAIEATAIGSGAVLQVVQTVKTDTFSSSSTSFTDITGMSVTITPTSATSKIMIMYNMNTSIVNGGYRFDTRLVRNGSVIAVGDSAGSRFQATTQAYSSSSAGNYPVYVQSMTFLDSPATTSSLTYKLQGVGWISSSGTFYVNLSAAEGDNSNYSRSISTITALEIAG